MDYMEQYDNHNILQQWVGCIEGHGVRKFDCIAIEEEMLKKAKLIIIYGAGHVGKGCLRLMRPKYHVDYFAVTHPIPEKSIMGVPVVTIDELLAVREQAVVVVGVGIQYQGEVVDLLHKLGFHQLIFSYISPL